VTENTSDFHSEVLPIAGYRPEAMVDALRICKLMNKLHRRNEPASTKQKSEKTWVSGKWGYRVDARGRNRAYGAERRAVPMTDRSCALRNFASSSRHSDLFADQLHTRNLCLEGSRPAAAIDRFPDLEDLELSRDVKRSTPAGRLCAVKSGARFTRGHETVVVVAEHAPSRSVVSRLLKRMRYRVVEAANGKEAQKLVAGERRIDLLLAEFSALGASGVELVRWFSVNRPETKVLVASDWLWEVESCLGDLPRVGVLANQFTPTELARMVRAILH